MSIDSSRVLPYVTGMHNKTALLFAALALYGTAALAVEYPGVCAVTSASGARLGGPCIVSFEPAPAPIDGARYQLDVRGLPQRIGIEVSGPSCTAAGVPCVQQPTRTPGTLSFVDEEGGRIQFTAPPRDF